MSRTPWICQSCLHRLAKRPITSFSRFASSAPVAPLSPASTAEAISPSLLIRARATAQEHTTLTQKLASTFDTSSAKRLGELTPVTTALTQYDSASYTLAELNSLLNDPNTDAELRTLASEDISTATTDLSNAARTLTEALVPIHPFAHLPCLIEIRPGVGGSEAALFAGDLLRMYTSYCQTRGLRANLLKYEASDGVSDPNGSDAPLQEAILEVESPGAYGILRSEAGVHRVQRVPATESKGRVHTSVASVLVLPSFPERSGGGEDASGVEDFDDPNSDYYINPSDVRTDVMRARGAGGQHVNTTDSAVRLTHIPTSTVVAIQDSRSQLKNRAKAWQVLRARLAQAKREAREEEMLRLRRSVTGMGKTGRGDKVRTYNWGQQRVTDHRSGVNVHDLGDVMEGGEGLHGVVESVRRWVVERETEALVVEEEMERERRGKEGVGVGANDGGGSAWGVAVGG